MALPAGMGHGGGASLPTGGWPAVRLRGVASWVFPLLLVHAVLTGVFLAVHFSLLAPMLAASWTGTDVQESEGWFALFGAVMAAGLVMTAVSVAVLVLNIVWSYRMMGHLTWLGYDGTWTSGWAVAAWLVPYANLILPLLLMRDAWRFAHAIRDGRGAMWRSYPLPGWITGLWIVWMAGMLVAMGSYFAFALLHAAGVDLVAVAVCLGILGAAFPVVGAFLVRGYLRHMVPLVEGLRSHPVETEAVPLA